MAAHWIWQEPDWPAFTWRNDEVLPSVRALRIKLGLLLGRAAVDPDADREQELDTLLANIVSSSAIENEQLNVQSVRSSLARRLGVSAEHPHPVSDRSEGLAEMMLDAIQNREQPLTLERLLQWHRWLFPEHELRLAPIRVGQLRGTDPMQVVSGRLDRPTVHFEAPPREGLELELERFLEWFNHSRQDAALDPLLRAAVCHFWFVTLHPFDDGNGRITRALTDLALAQAESRSIRLYAMSVAILGTRKDYYRVLEQSQKGTLDITNWLRWFLDTLDTALDQALAAVERTLTKARFWQRFHEAQLNAEQVKVLNRLLNGGERDFEQGISAAQYQKVAKVSKATATRHLSDLLEKGCIEKLPGGGRSTRYRIKA